MPTLRLTKEFRFEGAHALTGYDGKCRHIHGHSYLLYVTVKGTPSNPDGTPKSGMLIDFTDLKRIVNEHIIDIFDHSLILRESAPLAAEIASAYQRVITVPFQPTYHRGFPAHLREPDPALRRHHPRPAARRSTPAFAPPARDRHLLRRVVRVRQRITSA